MKNMLRMLTLGAVLLLGLSTAVAQYVPTHPKYVTYIDGGKNFTQYFPNWQPGQQLSEDENFFISRVKIKDRFINRNSQVVPDNAHNNVRKFSLCTPMGISDTYWQTLPRYVMDGDNFGLWSYVDYQDGWSQSWIRNVGAYSDVCHKNGVQTSGGVVFFDSWGGDNTQSNAIVNMITTKSNGQFKYLDKFCKYLRYYGIDGVTFNPEGTVPNAAALQDFFIAVREKMKADYNLPFHVNWYFVSRNGGSMDLGSSLTDDKADWFVKGGKEVCDVSFLNYDWHQGFLSSIQTAEKLKKGSTSNLFGGYDIQGNWLGRATWTTFKNTDLSICFWGNHTTDMIYQNSTELGSADEGVQANYLTKQEQVFCGGNRNVANLPAIANGIGSSSTAAMKKFHGIAALMPARSSLQELPFITRFTLGNGKVFRYEGQETFNQKWYSLSSQDYLPTWRWWITDASNAAPADPIECGFTFDDSWYAGSCMTMKGATKQSIVRLFKTNFNVTGTDAVNFIYKLKNGTDTHARLVWSFVGSETTLHKADIAGAKAAGEWTEFATTAAKIGMTGNVAMIGLEFDNTASDYEMLVGEFGIVPQKSFSPVKPTITKATLLERTYQGTSYKIIWDCGKSAAAKADASVPTYNDDVDVWYFEVFSQAEGFEPRLEGMTTSWAHYVVGGFAQPDVANYRFGVRAVAPDGKTMTDITWSNWQTLPVTYVEGVSVDRPVIKQDELFTVSYNDPLHPAVAEWHVVDPATGKDVMDPATNATSISGRISTLGTYDLVIKNKPASTGTGGGSTVDAKPVLSEADIVEGQLYYIYTDARGGLCVKSSNDTRLWGTQESGVNQVVDNTNYLQHFKFVKQNDSYYLFNVATGKYVGGSTYGTLSATPTAPIHFADAGNGTVRLYFTADFNINLGGDCQYICDKWTDKDEGNSFKIMPTSAAAPTTDDDSDLVYRGLIQVSSDETGAVPMLRDFTADKTYLSKSENSTNVSIDVARLGEGKVSRGLKMEDAYQFRIPKEALPASQKYYSVGLWVKPEVLAHSKYGTNLINKRDVSISWPNNNWGAFWVIVWPEWKNNSGQVVLDENVISYTMYKSTNAGSLAGNSNIHETPFYSCVTDRQHPCGQTYALKPGTWTHVMITYDGSSQSIYFNGKLAVKTQTNFVQYNESPIYIGGSNVYHAGIKGTIDDVQVWHKALTEAEVKQAMMGYEGKTVPSELKAYYTFEETSADNTFPNHGKGGATLTGAYVGLEGGAGENTASTVEVVREPVTDVLGNATLPGSLEVKTSASISSPGFSGSCVGTNSASLVLLPTAQAGAYDVTVTLSNMWGEATLTKHDYLKVELPEGIFGVQGTSSSTEGQSGQVFDLQGRRQQSALRGIFVAGGKKVVK